MENLVSGMLLVEKTYGDLHYLISTPYGWKVIETSGNISDFKKGNYERAYIPLDYEDPWIEQKDTEIIF